MENFFTENRKVVFYHFVFYHFYHFDSHIPIYVKFIFIQKFIDVWKRSKVFLSNFECHSKSFILQAVNFSRQSSTFTSLPCSAMTELTDSKMSTKKHRKMKKQSSVKFLYISGFILHRNSCICLGKRKTFF